MLPSFQPGETVLLDFPYSDLTGVRRRPALVLLDTGDADIVVARITSHNPRDTFDAPVTGIAEAGLLFPSIVRVHKIVTVDKALVQRRLGTLSSTDWSGVTVAIRSLWEAVT